MKQKPPYRSPLPQLRGQEHPAGLPSPLCWRFQQGHGSRHSPREPRHPMPGTRTQPAPLGAPAGCGCPGSPMVWPSPFLHGRASPLISMAIKALGRRTLAGPTPWSGAATVTLMLSTPSSVKPPLHPAALWGHQLHKAMRCQPLRWCFAQGLITLPAALDTRHRSGQHCPGTVLCYQLERHHGFKNKSEPVVRTVRLRITAHPSL